MTEYDYSPGARQRELEKQTGIAHWAKNPSISNHSTRSGQQGQGPAPVTSISYPASSVPSQYNPRTPQSRSRAPSAHSSPQRAQDNSNMISYNGYAPGASVPAASPAVTNPFSDRHAASTHAPVNYTPSRLGSSCTTYHVANDHPQDAEDEVEQEFNTGYQQGYQLGQAAAHHYSRAPSATSNASTIRPTFPTTNSYPAGFVPKCGDFQRSASGMSAAPSAAPSYARSRTKSEGRSIRSGYAGSRSGVSEFGETRSILEPPIRRLGDPATPYYTGNGRPSPGPVPPLPSAGSSRSSARSLGTKRSMSNLHVPNPLPLAPNQSNYARVDQSFAAANSVNPSLAMTVPVARNNTAFSSSTTSTCRTLTHSRSYAAIPGATRNRTVSNATVRTVGRPSANRYATYGAAPPVPALPQAMPVQINVKPSKPFVLVTDDKAKVSLLSDGGANGAPIVWVKQGKQSQGEIIDYGASGASIVEADLYDNVEPKKKVVTKKKSFFSAFGRSK